MKHQSALKSGISMELCSFISSLLLILQRKFFFEEEKEGETTKMHFYRITAMLAILYWYKF